LSLLVESSRSSFERVPTSPVSPSKRDQAVPPVSLCLDDLINLCRHGIDCRSYGELHFHEPFPSRSVKQHRVTFRIPNRRELDTPGTVQAKVNSTRNCPPSQKFDRHGKHANLEHFVLAQCLIDVIPEVLETLCLRMMCPHWQLRLLELINSMMNLKEIVAVRLSLRGPVTQTGQRREINRSNRPWLGERVGHSRSANRALTDQTTSL